MKSARRLFGAARAHLRPSVWEDSAMSSDLTELGQQALATVSSSVAGGAPPRQMPTAGVRVVRDPAADGQRTSSVTSGGQLAVYRQEVRPFTDKQVALLKNFAAQAIITRNGISRSGVCATTPAFSGSAPMSWRPVQRARRRSRRLRPHGGSAWRTISSPRPRCS